jgi:hypothetical protein
MVAGGGHGEDGEDGVVGPAFIGEGSPVTLPWHRRCSHSPASSTGAHTVGTPPSDRRSVARARPVRRGHDGARPGRTPRSLGAWARGEGAAWDGGWPWAGCGADAEVGRHTGAARGRARHRGTAAPWPNCFADHQFENNFLQNLVYKCTKRWIRKL